MVDGAITDDAKPKFANIITFFMNFLFSAGFILIPKSVAHFEELRVSETCAQFRSHIAAPFSNKCMDIKE